MCNPQKSGPSRVCITFPKTIFQKTSKEINKKTIFLTYFGPLKQITDNSSRYLHSLFLPESNKCFFVCLVLYIHTCLYSFLILCSYCQLLFLTHLATRHSLQFTVFDDFIATCPYITEIKKALHNPNKYSNIIIFDTEYELFLLPYQITFLSAFGQAKIFFSYHILINILIYISFCDKKINNILYRKWSPLNCKQREQDNFPPDNCLSG